VKAVFVAILFYNLYASRWFEDLSAPRSVAHPAIERFFLIYLLLNALVAFLLIVWRRLPGTLMRLTIFAASFVDGLFLAALMFVTGGFDSILYWLLLGLIVRNALSVPLATPQIILNLSVSFCYVAAGLTDAAITHDELDFDPMVGAVREGGRAEPFLLRLIVLWLLSACCYGIQVLFEKQRQGEEEAREFLGRQEQLRSAGRLAAQIAHQIKNPLGIINNAAYSLQKALQGGREPEPKQVQIIREEVEHADGIITKLMGYAQLAEGKVERLHVTDEIERALAEVFPRNAQYAVEIEKDYSTLLPPLLMQRAHLSEILVNILQNAREALGGKGRVTIRTRAGPDNSVLVTIGDSGPGIPKDRIEKIFQPYYSTKDKGTGLGLAIVKSNVEIYGGTVRVESELGKGARFILQFPTKTFMKMQA
jgi:signal transduction histidine kinase